MKRKQARRKQGYYETSCCCESCANAVVKLSDDAKSGKWLIVENSHRCGIGGFKIKMNGTCRDFEESIVFK